VANSGCGRGMRRCTVPGCRRLERSSRQLHIGASDVRGLIIHQWFVSRPDAVDVPGRAGWGSTRRKHVGANPAPFLKFGPVVAGITSLSGLGGARWSAPGVLSKLAAQDRTQAVRVAPRPQGLGGIRRPRCFPTQEPKAPKRSGVNRQLPCRRRVLTSAFRRRANPRPCPCTAGVPCGHGNGQIDVAVDGSHFGTPSHATRICVGSRTARVP
jgi:hypothetical protein